MTDKHYNITLNELERATLTRIARTGNRYEVARARVLLLTDGAADVPTIAERVKMSERRVRYWLRQFKDKRLDVFRDSLLEQAANHLPPRQEEVGDQAQPPKPVDPPPPSRLLDEPAEPEPELLPSPPAVEVIPAQTAEPEPPAPEGPGIDKPRLKLKMAKSPGIEPGDPMSEAGRKTLLYHFERMLYHEPGTRLGEDIEALHDMRVATRRMRAAFQVFGGFFRGRAIKPFVKGARATGRALGAVRDLDVFMEKVDHYQAELTDDARGGMAPLLDSWLAQRERAREHMTSYLDSPRYTRFIDDFADFLHTPDAGARPLDDQNPTGYLVRHVAPRLVYERLEAVRAYDTVLDSAPIETLHALRIEFKRFRYTLEYFEEVLGPEVKNVIREVKAMQDHLGDLNDADVAGHSLQQFIAGYEDSQVGVQISERRSIDRVIQYMAYRSAEKYRLMVDFPHRWEYFNREEVRRDLALSVAAL
jgi:CHAD domain-containing protein